jgi:chitinase
MQYSRSVGLPLCCAIVGCSGAPAEVAERGEQGLSPGAAYNFGALAHPGSCMDAQGGGTTNGTQIQEWTCNGTGAQSFQLEDAGNGVFYILNTQANKCVDVQARGTADGTKIQLWDCNQSPAQTFILQDAGNGFVSFVNTNSNKCLDVEGDNPADGTVVQLYDCNGTNAQIWNLTVDGGSTGGGSTQTDSGTGALGNVVGGYYPNWVSSPPRVRDVDPHYNVIYLFAATPVGGPPGNGNIAWSPPDDTLGAATNLVADIAYARQTQGRRILMSVGGAGNNVGFPDRATSQTFVSSFAALYAQLGGLDGLDWDNYEATDSPDTTEMIWISQQLKSMYPGFLITSAPAPWSTVDQTFCSQMAAEGALDYCAPQYYDGPDLAEQSYVVPNVDTWAGLLGEGRLVVGFGIANMSNYMTVAQVVSTWHAVKANHPNLRGAFDWQIDTDDGMGWPFAIQVGPLVSP